MKFESSLLIFILFLLPMLALSKCPERHAIEPHRPLTGGYSGENDATTEELYLLKKVWFEASQKCPQLPEEFDRVEICSVRRQIVAGVNYRFLLALSHDKVTVITVYVPLNNVPRVTSCDTRGVRLIDLGE